MKKHLVKFLLTLILPALGIWCICIYFQASSLDPACLPDHDYIPEIKNLMADKQFRSAEDLCCNVIGMGLPRQDEAALLLQECRAAQRDWQRNAKKAVCGFLTGKGEDTASLAGAVASDLTLYGDLRDLSVQGYRKLKGLPVDPVLAALSGIGLAAEAAGLWAAVPPALVKGLYKTGAFTAGLLEEMRKVFQKLRSQKKLDAADKQLLENLKELVIFQGLHRAKTVLPGIRTAKELEAAVKLQKIAPEVPGLIALGAPRESGRLFVRFSTSPVRISLLKSAARKGSAGTELLKKIRFVKWGAKNIRQGRFHALLLSAALENPAFRRTLPWIAIVFFLLTATINGGTILRILRKRPSTAEPSSQLPLSDNVPDSSNNECSCSSQIQAADASFSASSSENGEDKLPHSGRS